MSGVDPDLPGCVLRLSGHYEIFLRIFEELEASGDSASPSDIFETTIDIYIGWTHFRQGSGATRFVCSTCAVDHFLEALQNRGPHPVPFLSSLLKRDCLTPTLRQLRIIDVQRNPVTPLFSLATSALSSLSVTVIAAGSNSAVAQLLQPLTVKSPNLVEVQLRGNLKSPLLNALEGMRIRKLTLELSNYQFTKEDDFRRIVHTLSNLRDFVIEINSRHFTFPIQNEDFSSTSPQQDQFTLQIKANIPTVISLLSSLATPSNLEIDLQGNWHLTEVMRLIPQEVVARENLRRFQISSPHSEESASEFLDAVTSLPSLTSLHIIGISFPSSDEHLASLCLTPMWIHLQTLDLARSFQFHSSYDSTLSVASMRILAVHCPSLIRLHIFLPHLDNTVKEVQDSRSRYPGMSHGLRSIMFSSIKLDDYFAIGVAISRYLDHIFPGLHEVETDLDYMESWCENLHLLLRTFRSLRNSQAAII
ncbi:hypothetical protein CPB83DRAFT_904790 [Crepidotus variabilis]|uniref:Uncharacterized protein n=1 Tax=Crepidotus variabilis TaxID=179855 RepID=A0A9P6ELC4_9AGAR|nr:hypothetical protein CPB83DRAFT_904790 [Crepidotus variabilis]